MSLATPDPVAAGPSVDVLVEDGDITLLDDLLREQQELTAVERFARLHDEKRLPAKTDIYRHLIPLSKPGPGEQYAFEVNLDKCTGCKACVAACHSLNGLEPAESWRDVGVLFGGTIIEPIQQTVTTACHHCADPGCLNGCPVEAYEKDAETGIVRHLDDQCIGCQYCILKCPYDVPKYSAKRGIVRKCDMCHQRLAVGEAPACVQACPTEAIQIRIVQTEQVKARVGRGEFLPDTPDPAYTQPTTRYVSERDLPHGLRGADRDALQPEHSHWPLVAMLVLTQGSVGAFLADALLSLTPGWSHTASRMQVLLATGIGMLGLTLAVFHLGQPLKAWRFFLGLRTSWLSRELLVFNFFAGAATALAALAMLPWVEQLVAVPSVIGDLVSIGEPMLRWAVPLFGLAGIWCSIKIYEDTRRPFWRMSQTGAKFIGSTILLGAALTLPLAVAFANRDLVPVFAAILIGASFLKLAWEGLFLGHCRDGAWSYDRQSARLMAGPLRRVTWLRSLAGGLGGVVLPTCLLTFPTASPLIVAMAAALVVLVGELAERYLFFTAVVALKMPGGVKA